MISQLREPTRPLRVALATPLVFLGVHPNAITLAAVPLAGVAALLLASGRHGLALVFALLACAMDFLDGEVARIQNLGHGRSVIHPADLRPYSQINQAVGFGVSVFNRFALPI